MTVYRYSGPMTVLEIRGVGEVTLVADRLYDLPPDAPNVAHLAARGAAAAKGRKAQKGRLIEAVAEKDERVVRPAKVALKPNLAPDRNVIADTLKAMREGVKHPDVAAEAQAAAEQAAAPTPDATAKKSRAAKSADAPSEEG